MPTYEYTCDSCRYEFECEQRIVDPPITKCPSCGKKKVRRLVSNGNFILRGSGWYADGYGLHAGHGASSSSSKISSDDSKPDDKKPANGGNGSSDSVTASTSSDSSKESGKGSGKGSTAAAATTS